jgi:hypothetical protein
MKYQCHIPMMRRPCAAIVIDIVKTGRAKKGNLSKASKSERATIRLSKAEQRMFNRAARTMQSSNQA